MRKPKFKVGDKVKIIKYGSLLFKSTSAITTCASDQDHFILEWHDIQPELVGQIGVVEKCTTTQGVPIYAIEGIKGKHAWYDEEQMRKLNLFERMFN